MALRLSGDFETTSRGSLPQIGAHKYARLPTTRILCFAYAIDDDDPVVWFPSRQPPPEDLIEAARDPELEFRAWNAAFEFNIWNAVAMQARPAAAADRALPLHHGAGPGVGRAAQA